MASRCSAAASLLAKTPPVVHATTSRQLLNSTLDLLLLALGVDAAAVECDVVGSFSDFHCLRLFWPEGEACLLLQRYLDPDDPDMHSLIMHRLLLGWPEGHLSLEASYGPSSGHPACLSQTIRRTPTASTADRRSCAICWV